MKRNYVIATLGVATLCLQACKVPQTLQDRAVEKMPTTFVNENRDTAVKISTITVDQFFADKHLLALINKAMTDNLDYKIALQRIDIAGAYLSKSRGALLPGISGLANGSATRYGKYTMEGVGNFDTNLSPNIEDDQRIKTNPVPHYFMGIGLDWEIDIWGKLRNKKKAAFARYMATVEGKHLLESNIVAHIALVYYDLIALDQEIAILNNNIKIQDQALGVVNIHYEVGKATLLAVKQMEAQLRNSKSMLSFKKQELAEAENTMRALIGEYEGSVVRSEQININAVKDVYAQAVPTHMMEYRPDIRRALLELQATKADVLAARAAFFPTLNISGYAALNAFSGELLFNPASFAWQLFGGLTAPIFNKNQIRSDFKIATAEQEIAFLELQKSAMNAYREVNLVLNKIYNTNEAYQEKSKEVTLLSEGVEVSQDLYMSGYANYVELLTARKSKLDAELDIVLMKRMQVQNLIQLYKALGGGYSTSK